jgi:polysaccharide pyruvyl transferase WcaK-like protein
MISGTFHGAVFALGQGIPVVALAVTDEYRMKLSGLAAEFGEKGCQIVNMGDCNFEQSLRDAIEFAWLSADQLRPQLLEDAERQIKLGIKGYEKIFKFINAQPQAH